MKMTNKITGRAVCAVVDICTSAGEELMLRITRTAGERRREVLPRR